MTGKHTPGPWGLSDKNNGWRGIDSVPGRWVSLAKVAVDMDGKPSAEGDANARLIAAAPELARALADLLADAVEMGLDDSPVSGSLIEARKALAKAGVPVMNEYIVLYREPDDRSPAAPPLLFHCQADDGEHAEEQCENAYPGCRVAWVYEGSDWRAAMDDFLGVL